MSSPAAQAREKRRRSRYDAVATRPETEPPNSPWPQIVWDVRQLLTIRMAIVYAVLCWCFRKVERPRRADGKDTGFLIPHQSITQIAIATRKFTNPFSSQLGFPMPRRTVAHCLDQLISRYFIERWDDQSKAKHSPVGTSWRVLPWWEVWEKNRTDPKLAHVPPDGKRLVTFGKGKVPGGPEKVAAWNIDFVLAEKVRGAVMIDIPKPADHVESPPVSAPAAPAAVKAPVRVPVAADLIEEVAIVHRAILATGVMAAEPEHAAALLAIAREVIAAIPAESVASLVRQLADGYRLQAVANPSKYGWTTSGGPIFWTVGWFRNDMAGAAHGWKLDHDRAQMATGTRI